jgi:hypothetical protein
MGKQLDEESIFEVARAISDRVVRAKYLNHVCSTRRELRERIEERVATWNRKSRGRWWQFSLRTLLVVMLVAASLSAGLAISVRATMRAQRMAEMARMEALRAAEQAEAALRQATRAAQSLQRDASK